MVTGHSRKKDAYDVVTKTIYIGEITIPPGKYRGDLKREDDKKVEALKSHPGLP